jgi:lysophospholipase L1-like esterase
VEDVFAPTRFFDRDVAPPPPEKLGNMSRSQQLRWNRTADFRATAARDCLHPNVEGYGVLLDAVARRLQPQLSRRSPERCGTT